MLHIYLHLQRAVRILSIPLVLTVLSACASNTRSTSLSEWQMLNVAATKLHTICLDSPTPLQKLGQANRELGSQQANLLAILTFRNGNGICWNSVPIELEMVESFGFYPGKWVRKQKCWDLHVYRAIPTRNPTYDRDIFAMTKVKCGKNV